MFFQNGSRSWCRSSISLCNSQIAGSDGAAVGKLWPGQNGLDLHPLWSTRSSMEMEALWTVRSLFSAFFPCEPAMVDAILFPIDAHSFVREGRRSVLERDVLKRSVKRPSVFRHTYRQSFRLALPLGHNVLL